MLLKIISHKFIINILGLAIILFFIWFIFGFNISLESKKASKKSIVSLYDEINLNDSEKFVESVIDSPDYIAFKLYKDQGGWVIKSPSELGGSEWLIIIDFEKGKVRAVRIRVADGNFYPKCAPPDKIAFDIKKKLAPATLIDC